MTQERKNAIVDDIMALLIQLTDEEAVAETKANLLKCSQSRSVQRLSEGLVNIQSVSL